MIALQVGLRTVAGALLPAGEVRVADPDQRRGGLLRGEFYRQMVFNALLGNTDDHLKNFALRREPVGWRLTPAFDLLPDVTQRGEHCLHFGPAGHRPGREALRTLAGAFGVSRQRAALILDEVSAAVAGWRARFDEYGVPSGDSERLGRDIERRLVTRA